MPNEEVGQHDKSDSQAEGYNKASPAVLVPLKVAADHDSKHTDSSTQVTEQQNRPPSPFREWILLHWEKLKNVGMHEWVMVLATVFMAGSTIAYTVYSSKQVSVMKETLAEMKRESSISYRAWIAPLKVTVASVQTDRGIDSALIKLDIKNVGNGPGFRVIVPKAGASLISGIGDIDTKSFFSLADGMTQVACSMNEKLVKQVGHFDIAVRVPGEPTVTAPINIPHDIGETLFPGGMAEGYTTIERVKQGRAFGIYGCIVYTDQSREMRHTHYCFVNIPDRPLKVGDALSACNVYQIVD